MQVFRFLGIALFMSVLFFVALANIAVGGENNQALHEKQGTPVEQGISAPDARLSTPEDAFKVFKAAIRNGNIADLKACTTPYFWQQWGEAFQQLTPEQGYEMGLKMEDVVVYKAEVFDRYAILHLQTRSGSGTSPVNLEKISGNWRVDTLILE